MLAIFLVVTLSTASSSKAPTASGVVVSGTVKATEPCDRRADILAVRHASTADRAALRARFDQQVTSTQPGTRARGCAAAVAAEAAIFDGDQARTLLLLDDVVGALPELASSLLPHRALLSAELGKTAEAEALLAAIPEQQASWRVRVELAVARSKKDAATTTALLLKAASRDPVAVDALCAQGVRERCVDLLLRFAGHPLARAREDAVDVVDAVGGFSAETMAARVRGLLAAGRPLRAEREGRAWLAKHVDDVGSGVVVEPVGDAMWRAGHTSDALAFCEAHPRRANELAWARARARAQARLGRFDAAGASWQVAERAAGDDNAAAAEAAFFSAFSLVEGDDPRAIAALAAVEARVVGTSWETQAQWYRALLLLTDARPGARAAVAALALFETLVGKNDKEVRKHRYWRARALDVVGAAGADGAALLVRAKSERQALSGEDALDWYGQLARRDLGLKPMTGKPLAADALQKLVVVDDDARAVRLLFSLGFDDEARDRCRAHALTTTTTSLVTPPPVTPSTATTTTKPAEKRASLGDIGLCQLVDDATFGWRRGALYLPHPSTQKNRLNASPSWRVSYAMPWVEIVDEAARVNTVPRSFVYAIMRTESGFAADAVSVAGARGVLQLLPSVARAVGAQVPHSSSGGVDDDIQLGAGLLGLLHRQHGSLLLAAAAYNGAPENAQAWVTRWGALPVDVFVERVPFRETRDYIKRVLAVEAVYRGLDGGEAALALPTTLAPATSFTRFPYDE